MRNARRSMPITILAAALAAGTAACGGSGSSAAPGGATGTKAASSATADPLAGLDSKQIAQRAVAGTETAPSVRITGTVNSSGQTFTLNLTLVREQGCEGTLTEPALGSFRLIYDTKTTWILPDSKFYKSQHVPAAAAALLSGKYLQFKAGTAGLGSMSQLCTVSNLLNAFAADAGTAKGVPATVDGQPAVKITDKTGAGVAYVTDTAAPKLLRIQKPGSDGGRVDFGYPATAVAITPPPASQTIDASKFGL